MAKAIQVNVDDSDHDVEDILSVLTNSETINDDIKEIVRKVECDSSPFFYAFYNHHPCWIVLDTGATSSVISRSFLRTIGISPHLTLHSA